MFARAMAALVMLASAVGCSADRVASPVKANAPGMREAGRDREEAEALTIRLFDGVSLDGWTKVGGSATYHVEDGCIVGEVGPGPNTFLRTVAEYADFDLMLEVRLDVPGNSGIQFRSHQKDGTGQVYGYQCEIDPSSRAWSGGLYDEGRRGWLVPLEQDHHASARAAFRVDDWNTYRIRAVGPRIQTWVNGVPCVDYTDDADASGFIALQVHAGPRGRIRWRNITLTELSGASEGRAP